METIKNYLDNMFAGFPKTPEIMKLKNDLMLSMEDKYNELKYSGKSENEAVGIVISEFGNIDELVKEMGISTSTVLNEKPLPLISMSIAEEFIQSKKRFGN